MSPTRRGARSTPATARPGPARPTGASPTSCSRSGRRRPTASSAATCMRAPGCRSTTTTPCSCFLWWKRAHVGACRCRSRPTRTARRSAAPAAATSSCPTPPTGSGRWRMADERGQRLGHRPRGAAQQRDLQRHRRHPPAGPGDHREHGADRRPRLRAPGAVGPDDHPHAPAPAAGGARAARRGRPAARRRGRRASIAARAAATSSATTGPWQEVYAKTLAAAVHPPTARRAPSHRAVTP